MVKKERKKNSFGLTVKTICYDQNICRKPHALDCQTVESNETLKSIKDTGEINWLRSVLVFRLQL